MAAPARVREATSVLSEDAGVGLAVAQSVGRDSVDIATPSVVLQVVDGSGVLDPRTVLDVPADEYVTAVCSLDLDAESAAAILRLPPHTLHPVLSATLDGARRCIEDSMRATASGDGAGSSACDGDDAAAVNEEERCQSPKASTARVARYCATVAIGIVSRCGSVDPPAALAAACDVLECAAPHIADSGVQLDIISSCCPGLRAASTHHGIAPITRTGLGGSDWRSEGAMSRAPIEAAASQVPPHVLPLWSAPRDMCDLGELARLVQPLAGEPRTVYPCLYGISVELMAVNTRPCVQNASKCFRTHILTHTHIHTRTHTHTHTQLVRHFQLP